MNKVETITLMQTIIAMYPGTQIRMDEISVGVWHEMLKDLPAEVVGAACKRMCATLKYPPSIADIRGAVADAAKDAQGTLAAGEAWARVKKAVSLYGYYRPDAARKALGPKIWRAVEMVGGWQEVCAGDEDTSVRSAQFERRPLGKAKMQKGGGLQGHNGLRNIKERVGNDGFWRLRIGIGRPKNNDVRLYVTTPFTKDEAITLSHVFDKINEKRQFFYEEWELSSGLYA